MEETRVPVYLITGFLESGKTSFLSFTLQQDYFQIDGKTLLILCEEGEEEYDEEALKQSNTVVESHRQRGRADTGDDLRQWRSCISRSG